MQQVQKSVDNQFKKAIEQYRDDPDLQNAIDSVQKGVSKEIMCSVVLQMYVAYDMNSKHLLPYMYSAGF